MKSGKADFIGSMGGPHWLWAWANAYLPLQPEQTAASRRVRDSGLSIAAAGGLLCEGLDPLAVLHRLGALTLGITGADAYYVANASQLYAIARGELGDDFQLFDLWGAINDALYDPPSDPGAAIRFAADRHGVDCLDTDAGLELVHGDDRIVVQLEGDRILGVEATL